jgi:hypothetical protein
MKDSSVLQLIQAAENALSNNARVIVSGWDVKQ